MKPRHRLSRSGPPALTTEEQEDSEREKPSRPRRALGAIALVVLAAICGWVIPHFAPGLLASITGHKVTATIARTTGKDTTGVTLIAPTISSPVSATSDTGSKVSGVALTPRKNSGIGFVIPGSLDRLRPLPNTEDGLFTWAYAQGGADAGRTDLEIIV